MTESYYDYARVLGFVFSDGLIVWFRLDWIGLDWIGLDGLQTCQLRRYRRRAIRYSFFFWVDVFGS
jgi:hypothetical protein